MARETLQLKLAKGDQIGDKWVVMRRLGEGGCGAVYHCKHMKRPDEEVAIKVLENARDEKRFLRERKVLSAAASPYVLRFIDSGRHQGHPFMVLEFMAGGSLRDLMDRVGKLPKREAAWVLIMAIKGLRKARTLHRDLKPENLLVNRAPPKGGTGLVVNDIRKGATVKVADFGLAKDKDPTVTKLTGTGQIMGTPLYMSPEQCRNTRDVDIRSDIYSLGCILFEMLTGKTPFDADNAYDLMAKHCNHPVEWPKGLDPDMRAILEKCLAKDVKQRYQGLYQFEKDLNAVAGIGEPEAEGLSAGTWFVIIAGVGLFIATAWLLRDQLLDKLFGK